MAVAVFVAGVANAALTFAGLLLCMPCMLSDVLGSMALMAYLKRTGRGKVRLPRLHAFVLGGLSGLLGSLFFLGFLLIVFLVFGNLGNMASSGELLGNSITGISGFSVWLVALGGLFIVLAKMIISAIAVSMISSGE